MLVPHDYWIFENAELNSAFKLGNLCMSYRCKDMWKKGKVRWTFPHRTDRRSSYAARRPLSRALSKVFPTLVRISPPQVRKMGCGRPVDDPRVARSNDRAGRRD